MALLFTLQAKNAYLDTLTGKTTSASNYSLGTNLKILTNASVLLTSDPQAVVFSPAVGAVATMTTQSITPAASGVAGLLTWYGVSSSYTAATGTVSLPSGGGNFIVNTLNFTNGVPVMVACALKMPLNNGGTLNFNQALANQWLKNIMSSSSSSPAMANGGTVSFYGGTQPVNADTAIAGQPLLGAISFVTSDYASAANGATALSAAKSITPSAAGTATWFRWVQGGLVMDGTVGATGADFIVANANFVAGTPVNLTAATLTHP